MPPNPKGYKQNYYVQNGKRCQAILQLDKTGFFLYNNMNPFSFDGGHLLFPSSHRSIMFEINHIVKALMLDKTKNIMYN